MDKINQASSSQRKRIMEAFKTATSKGLSTIFLMEHLDVMRPSARISELRWKYGYNIQTVYRTDTNAQGGEHVCAYYVLLSGKFKAPKKKKAA